MVILNTFLKNVILQQSDEMDQVKMKIIDEEAEAKKAWMTHPKSRSWKVAVLIPKPAMIVG